MLESFLNTYNKQLIQLYITERQRNGNTYGILNVDLTNKDKADVSFIPITSDVLTTDLKLDIEKRRSDKNFRNNIIYVYCSQLVDNKISTNLIEIEL